MKNRKTNHWALVLLLAVLVAVSILLTSGCNFAFIPKKDLREFRYGYIYISEHSAYPDVDVERGAELLREILDNWLGDEK